MNPSIANFVVLTWPQGGPNGRLINNLPNTLEYTYVASAINIMLSMVESDQGRQALTDLAGAIDDQHAGLPGGSRWNGNRARARSCVDMYLRKLRSRFPPVVINLNTMTNINVLGYTPRMPWQDGHDDLEEFDPRAATMIHLNGSVCTLCLPTFSLSLPPPFFSLPFLVIS